MMDRVSICEGYWLFYIHWHRNGMTERCARVGRLIGVQLERLRFRPSPTLTLDSASEQAREVYEDLVNEYHFGACPYGDA